MTFELVNLSPAGGAGSIAGHQWTSPSGRYTFASFEGGTSPGVAVVDHAAGNQVVQTWPYTRPAARRDARSPVRAGSQGCGWLANGPSA